MSTQTTISQYFATTRKRPTIVETKSQNQANKLLISDKVNSSNFSDNNESETLILKRKISWDNCDDQVAKKKHLIPDHYNPKRTPKFTTIRTSIKKKRIQSAEKSTIRKQLFSNSNLEKSYINISKESDLNQVSKPLDSLSLSKTNSVDLPSSSDSSDDQLSKNNYLTSEHYNPKRTQQFSAIRSGIKKTRIELAGKSPSRKQLFPNSDEENEEKTITREPELNNHEPLSTPLDSLVPNEVESTNLPSSSANDNTISNDIASSSTNTIDVDSTKTKQTSKLREELGLGELKAKLKGNSRLNKIRDAINKINKGYDKLADIQARKDKIPSLKQFDTIELEVPCSPVKSPFKARPAPVTSTYSPSKLRDAVFKSPAKAPPTIGTKMPYVSPRKLLEEMRPRDLSSVPSSLNSPLYERYSSIAAQTGKPCLPLPYSYRILGEMFRSIDVVVSMMFNRKETVYFSKLKPSAQELTKKTVLEHHLGQILKVFPNAFRLTYERVKVHGKPDRYELAVHPVLPNNASDNKGEQMVPSTLLERQRFFYNQLLDLVKSHHEAFLLSLDPPLVVDKDKLTRWHPGFDLDSCPDIESSDIPQPPPVENFSSAKLLLGKAKEMFMVNPRMEKALEKLSNSDNRVNSDGKPSAASAIPGLANALKGLPKSLLEKVRAKQAAKAVEMLTRDPEKTKRDIEMSRLPEMARILRNLYVSERKNVMEKSLILDKLTSSYREKLSANEMDRHLMLLVEKTGSWLKLNKYGHVVYITMNKSMEMNNIYNLINSAAH